MHFRSATLSDLNGIMFVESQAFIPPIQESRTVFEQRLSAYPAGFFVLIDETDNTIAGYFSSELWAAIPQDEQAFSLGHSAAKAHDSLGTVMYISSVALLNKYRGKGLGEQLFMVPVSRIFEANETITQGVLLVNDVWKGAHHIYSKAGFSEYGRINSFFPTEQPTIFTDGILMSAKRTDIHFQNK
jgi:ribosomal-protein-alanine N-acetyltransferase